MRLRVGAGRALLRLLGSTWSLEWDGLDRFEAARRASPRGAIIYTFWHGSLGVLAYTHRRRDVQVLVSQHRDGELIARILEGMGYGLVRGSSRRGGVEALFRLATLLEAGRDVAVTVDGPIGPRYRVHPGVVLLSRRTGCPIVPITVSAQRVRRVRTWDGMQVPLPSSRVRVHYAEPIHVGERERNVPEVARHVQEALRGASRDEEAHWGRDLDFDDVQDRRSYWERASEDASPAAWLRGLASAHAAGLRVERRLRPRRRGVGGPPWVIGVGNLEAGGTGKTPCVALLAGTLAARGMRVAVLTRGHGGDLGRSKPTRLEAADLAHASDETRVLHEALGERATIVVSADKGRGLEFLRKCGGMDVAVVDDAFQTANLPVDRHVVLLDWERPLGNGRLLPAGRLREPPAALCRADVLLFTRARGDVLPPPHPSWGAVGADRLFIATEHAAGLRTPRGVPFDLAVLRGEGVALLCGIGRPQAFETLARQLGSSWGFDVRRAVRVGDHAPFEDELRKLVGRLEPLGCSRVILTRKDLLRLPPASKWNEPLLVLEQRLDIRDLPRLVEALLPRV